MNKRGNEKSSDVRFVRTKLAIRRLQRRTMTLASRSLSKIPLANGLLGLPSRHVRSLRDAVTNARRTMDWVESGKGPWYIKMHESASLSRHKPESVTRIDPALARERMHFFDETFVVHLPRAQVVGPNGIVITSDGGVVEESSWGRWFLDRDPGLNRLRHSPQELKGSYYSIASISSGGYTHWMLDALPRLAGLESVSSDDIKILVSAPLSDLQVRTLEMLGIGRDRVVVLEGKSIRVDDLYFPSFVGAPGNPRPEGCAWLRSKLLETEHPLPTRRLYVTRRFASHRHLVNEAATEAVFKEFGFETIAAEHLSIDEKIDTFGQASMIAGLHGSNLTNILFAPPKTRILEMRAPQPDCAFYALADAISLEYWYLMASVAKSYPQHASPAYDDLYVDPVELRQTLVAMTEEHDKSPD